jgi:hypothetical protein
MDRYLQRLHKLSGNRRARRLRWLAAALPVRSRGSLLSVLLLDSLCDGFQLNLQRHEPRIERHGIKSLNLHYWCPHRSSQLNENGQLQRHTSPKCLTHCVSVVLLDSGLASAVPSGEAFYPPVEGTHKPKPPDHSMARSAERLAT